MKLETFFNNFDQLAETPNAVSKIRELILQLAAHGKLVEQSSDDEPASALVGRIEKHIVELRSRKEFRGSPVEPLDREELPEIPLTWEWVRLGNVVDYGSSDKAESADIPEDAWLLDLEDIEKDTSRLLQRKSFRDSPSKSTKTAFAVEDVLYGKLRPYLNKVIVADAPGYCTTEIIPIRAFGFINPAYLCHALKRPEFITYANSKSYGMNLPRLGTEDARRAPFPLAPLAEQKRIVAKVDELMALCDRLEAQQQERETRHAALARASLARFADAPTPANLQFIFHPAYAIPPADLRKSILTLAVQGKLVPNDPREKPVALTLSGPSLEDVALPLNWRSGLVEDAFTFEYGDNLPAPKRTKTGEYPVYGSNGIVGTHDTYLTKEPAIIVGRKGSAGALNIANGPSWTTDVAYFVRPPKDIDLRFTYYLFSTLRLDELGKGIKPGLSRKEAYALPVALPPLAEQKRIVAKVEQLMALVDALETQLAASRATAANLLSALVAELTGAPRDGKVSPSPVSSTGRRGRPRKS